MNQELSLQQLPNFSPPVNTHDARTTDPFANPPPLQQAPLSKVERLLKLVCAVIGADWGGLARLSAEGELLEHTTFSVTGDGIDAIHPSDALHDSPWPSPFLRFVLRRHGVYFLVDAEETAVVEDLSTSAPRNSIIALSFAPASRSRGVVYFVRSLHRPAFEAEEEKTLRSFRSWLEQESMVEESHLLTKLRVLNQVAQIASNELSLPEMLARSLRELERYFPLHLHSVWLVDSEEHQEMPELGEGEINVASEVMGAAPLSFLVLADGKSSFTARTAKLGLQTGWRLPVGETPFGSCLGGEPAFYADLRQPRKPLDPLCEQLAERGASFIFAVPLRAGKRTVGILQVVSTCLEGFTNEHVQITYLVADLLGPAISNCQLVLRLRAAYQNLRATQDKLVQTEKMRALGELASGVAHNFNNSLCSVLGFLEIAMLDPALPPSCRRHLEASRVGALDAAQIVQRVQAFARPRQEGIGFEPLDVNALVSTAVELARPKWETSQRLLQKLIEVDVQAHAAAMVTGNPTELREVLANLIFNAVDAMPQGGQITVRAWNSAADVFISVRDTGMGMSDFVRQRVFEPLFTTKGQRGTGLGLSISFAVIQRHGGEITVESALGEGSTFTVRLPLDATGAVIILKLNFRLLSRRCGRLRTCVYW